MKKIYLSISILGILNHPLQPLCASKSPDAPTRLSTPKRKKKINIWHEQDLPRTMEQKDIENRLSYALGLNEPDWESAKKMVETNINLQTGLGDTILHYAVRKKHMPTIEWAVEHQANPTIVNFSGDTPVSLAADAHQINLVHALLKNQSRNIYYALFDTLVIPPINAYEACDNITSNDTNATASRLAATKRQAHRQIEKFYNTINYLATKNIITKDDLKYAINYPNRCGNVLLHYAAYYNHIPITSWALEQGALVNVVNIYGQTPVTLAARGKNKQTTKLLLSNYTQNIFCELLDAGILNRIDNANHTTSYMPRGPIPQINQEYDDLLNTINFCLDNHLSDERELKKYINYQDRYGNTLLHYAVAHRHIPTIQWALDQGANQLKINHENKTPLDIAANDNNMIIAQLLLQKNGQNVCISLIDSCFTQELSQEHKSHALQTLKFYVTHKLINLHSVSTDGYFPLIAAIKTQYQPLIQYCIDNQPDLAALNQADSKNFSPLLHAVETANPPIVEALIKARADIHTFNADLSLLDSAVLYTTAASNIPKEKREKYGELERLLIKYGAKFNILAQADTAHEPLFFAARMYDWNTIKQCKFDVNFMLPFDNTVLQFAACDASHTNNLSMVHWLLQQKADPCLHNIYGITPITIAAKQKNINLVRTLVGENPQDTCIQIIKASLVADPEHQKIQEEHLCATIKFLSENNLIFTYKPNVSNQFPLHTSIKHFKFLLTKWLIGQMPQKTLNQQDYEEMTPLALAVTNLQPETVRLLLNVGAQPNQLCHSNTPLDFLVLTLAKIKEESDTMPAQIRRQAIQAGIDIEGKLRKAGAHTVNIVYAVPIKLLPTIRNEKIGPNDPCPCESGKKYKKCCSTKK